MKNISLQWPGKGSTPPPGEPLLIPEKEIDQGENLLLQGDNYPWLNWLLKNGIQADLIYMDPPFCTGNRFSSKVRTRAGKLEVEKLGFHDSWNAGVPTFLEMLRVRLKKCRDLLTETGSIFVHLDWRVVHATKLIMDEIFGAKNFRNEIIWWYHDPSGYTKKNYMRKHDTILFYSKSDKYKFNLEKIRVPYSPGTLDQAEKGVVSFGRKTKVNPRGKAPEDVWEVPIINSQARERLGYPTQKPLALLERIIRGSSDPGDVIVDPFCGSGTTLEAADTLERKWIGIDQNNFGLFLARKRVKSEFQFRRDGSFLLEKGRELLQEYYEKNPSLGAKTFFSPDEKEIEALKKYDREEDLHWWDIQYPWSLVEKLDKINNKLFLFPLYDQTGLPLGRLDAEIEVIGEKVVIAVQDYEQPLREETSLAKLAAEELLETVNVLIDGEKKAVIMPPFPRKVSIPLSGEEQECCLEVVDIFGRERIITKRIG